MRTIRLVLLILPWVLVAGLLAWGKLDKEQPTETLINSSTVLREVEALGKLELVKYNFKEITELEELSKKYLNIFQLGPDSRIALISEGQAVGCLDLTKLKEEDVTVTEDTVYIALPKAELCYYKLDMEKTRIYSLQTNPLKDEKSFIQKAYKQAEKEIKESALRSGILKQTEENADIMLKPLIEQMSGRTVVFSKKQENSTIRVD